MAITTSDIISAAIGVGSSATALALYKTHDYSKATSGTQALISQILPGFESRSNAENLALEKSLSGYEAQNKTMTEQGLKARGISNPGVGPESVATVKSGLSGAYSAARAALMGAKINAKSAIEKTVSNYNISLAQKQYDSMLSQYSQKMGLWSALGGSVSATGKTLYDKSKQPQPVQEVKIEPTTEYLPNPTPDQIERGYK